jgi:oligopeptide/dipeptide ABC transporter ATP-binding protein
MRRWWILLWAAAPVCTAILWIGAANGALDVAPVNTPYLRPGWSHVLGADGSGRDIFALLIHSAGASLGIGLGCALFATAIGAAVGCCAGFWRSFADDLLMRLTDVFMLLPTLPLVIVLAAYLEPGVSNVAMVIALTSWPATARVVRAHVLKLREQPFIVNSRSMGGGDLYVIRRHILPNCSELLLAKSAMTAASAMTAEAGISFLGLGDPVHPSWGSMLHDAFVGAALINGFWWWWLPPILCIGVSVTLFNLAGQAVMGGPQWRGAATGDDARHCKAGAGGSIETCGMECGAELSLLCIRGLTVGFPASGARPVVDGLDLEIRVGKTIVVVGATGSGKSLLLLAVLGLLPPDARTKGRIWINGQDLARFSPAALRQLRGTTVAYVPQGVGDALNPVVPIGRQVGERACAHRGLSGRAALSEAVELLGAVGMPEPKRRIWSYPHHLSGGMKQRAALASALAGHPALLLADEPTKGLDPGSVQIILNIFRSLKQEAALVVTHDLSFAESLGGEVAVMHAGILVERAPAELFFREPLHPYCRALVAAQPSRGMQVDDDAWENRAVAPESEGGGCSWRAWCSLAGPECLRLPPLALHRGRRVRCWRYAS